MALKCQQLVNADLKRHVLHSIVAKVFNFRLRFDYRLITNKCYSHRLEFSESCLECQGNVREFYFGGLVGTVSVLCGIHWQYEG